MARQQRAIAAKQCNGAVRSEGYPLKEMLEVLQLYCAEDDAEELSVGSGDVAREKDRPRSRPAILHGLADKRSELWIGCECLEIVAVGHVDGGDRPVAREVDQLAVGADDRDGGELRQVSDLLLEHHMGVVAGYHPLEIRRRCDRHCPDALDEGGLGQLELFKGAATMLAQHA